MGMVTHHCCVNGRMQVLHQALVTQPWSNEPQSDMLLCKMKFGHGLLLLADVRVHHECHSHRFLAFCRTRLLLFVRQTNSFSILQEAGYCNFWSTRSRATPCSKHKIQSVHDPPIFGYARFSYWMHERLQYTISTTNHITTSPDKSTSFTPFYLLFAISSHLFFAFVYGVWKETVLQIYTLRSPCTAENKPRHFNTATLTTRHVFDQNTFLAIKLRYTTESSFCPRGWRIEIRFALKLALVAYTAAQPVLLERRGWRPE